MNSTSTTDHQEYGGRTLELGCVACLLVENGGGSPRLRRLQLAIQGKLTACARSLFSLGRISSCFRGRSCWPAWKRTYQSEDLDTSIAMFNHMQVRLVNNVQRPRTQLDIGFFVDVMINAFAIVAIKAGQTNESRVDWTELGSC